MSRREALTKGGIQGVEDVPSGHSRDYGEVIIAAAAAAATVGTIHLKLAGL
jgi:NAD(P)H-hydrate repair Nnr-like enzyme with NAD(P)H-hydrate epimerase domain